ncbi:MAG: thioredoxin [Candidatus Pacearchaeota archaeon]
MVARNDSAMEITNEEFDEIINNSHELVVVDFYAEWCMPCLMMSPIIEDLAEQIKEVKFTKINVDDNQALAGRYNVSSIPCLIIFKKGKEVGRIIGSRPADEIEEKIREYF